MPLLAEVFDLDEHLVRLGISRQGASRELRDADVLARGAGVAESRVSISLGRHAGHGSGGVVRHQDDPVGAGTRGQELARQGDGVFEASARVGRLRPV